jgi:arylsulfatase A-like enzyme
MVLNVDLAPTLLDLIGAEGAAEMQGLSFVPALAGRRRAERPIFFYQYDRETPYSTPSLMGVRTRDWKLVEYQEPGQAHELYDLKKDPREAANLYDDPRPRRRREQLARELRRLAPLAKVPRPMR